MDDPARSAGGTLGEYAYQQGGRERPMTEVLKDIIGNVQEMVRSEVRLARVELREEASKTARAGAMLAAGACLAHIAGVFPAGVHCATSGYGDAGIGRQRCWLQWRWA